MNGEQLKLMLSKLKLSAFKNHHQDIAIEAERESWSFGQYLYQLCEMEISTREQKRVERFTKQSELPSTKTLETLDHGPLPEKVKRQLSSLCDGHFVEKAHNLIVFGLPGRGKTHVLCAIGHKLVKNGVPVLFLPAFKLVQRLLIAKQELRLEKELRKLDRFDAVIIDDIGYIQQGRDEMEVLFTFLAERYERKSVMISSNLVFSQWDRIFKDPMTTAAAVDRLVHHSVILEMTQESYRTNKAKESIKAEDKNYSKTKENLPLSVGGNC
jgi:DNA replication protein DnaC